MTELPRRDIAVSLGNVGRMYFLVVADSSGVRRFSLGTTDYNPVLDTILVSLCLPNEQTFFWSTAKPVLDRAETLDLSIHKPDDSSRELFSVCRKESSAFRADLESPTGRAEVVVEAAPDKAVPEPVVPEKAVEPETVIYTDASRALTGRSKTVYGWLVQPADGKAASVVFDFKAVRYYETNRIEALGILSAIVANGDKKNLVIYSDSKAGAVLANQIIDDVRGRKGVEDWFIQRHIKRPELAAALSGMTVDIRWVKGHTGNLWNECIDIIVTSVRHQVNASETVPKDELVKKARARVAKHLAAKSPRKAKRGSSKPSRRKAVQPTV